MSRGRTPAFALALLSPAVVVVAAVACRSQPSPPPLGARDAAPPSLVAARPFALAIPRARPGEDGAPRPLVVVLHGYGSTGRQHEAAWGFSELGAREGFVVAAPDGTPDKNGARFWNASEACCDFGDTKVDDVAYLRAVLDDAAAQTPIDPKRVYVVGHSNGGFMAHRLACELSDRVAAIVSLAGAVGTDPACPMAVPVAVVQVHGTRDTVVSPSGGVLFDQPKRAYPSLAETMARWESRLGCVGAPEIGAARFDLDARLPGAETRVDRWRGCRAPLELWTIEGGSHVPAMGRAWAETVWAFFKGHPHP